MNESGYAARSKSRRETPEICSFLAVVQANSNEEGDLPLDY